MPNCPNCSNSHDSSGFTSGFLLGMVMGGAGGYLLSTDKGKELLSSLKETGGEKLAEVMDNPAIAEKLAELENTMATARDTIKKSSESAREKIHQAAEEVAKVTEVEKPPKKKLFSRLGSPLK